MISLFGQSRARNATMLFKKTFFLFLTNLILLPYKNEILKHKNVIPISLTVLLGINSYLIFRGGKLLIYIIREKLLCFRESGKNAESSGKS